MTMANPLTNGSTTRTLHLDTIFVTFFHSGLSTLANVVTSLATMDGNKQNGSGESEEDSQTNSQNGDFSQKEVANEVNIVFSNFNTS